MPKRKYSSDSLYMTDRKAYYAQKKNKIEASEKSDKNEILDTNAEKMMGFAGGSWEGRAGFGRSFEALGVNSALRVKYPNLVGQGTLYTENGGYITISEIVWLCQKAWEEFQLFRNTIEAMVEFSMSEIKLSGKNKSAKNFCETWLKAAKINDFSEQFYRELYRSCNVFVYPIKGKITNKDAKDLKIYAREAEIPIKYTVLNPAQVALFGGLTADSDIYKILSPYEIKRLRSPKTQAEKIMYQKLDPEIKQAIQDYAGLTNNSRIYVPLGDVTSVFYQKQDYEFFAVPLFYGVLNDIELKLEMKKADKKVLKTIENVIMTVTLGGYKGQDGEELPPNPEHMTYLRELFQNQEAQRVLVSDYTTKVNFVIPDIDKIVGKEKYAQVNEDIREGLQSIFGSNEKFSNQMTKVKVFCERLKKGQDMFKEWLEGELSNVCNAMGFSEVPRVKMSSIDLEDPTQTNRIYVRMAELGFLTPQELNEAIETGILPSEAESKVSQEEYKKQREDGLYFPQMFNNITKEDRELKEKESIQKANPPQSNGRPAGATQPQSGTRQSRVVGNIKGISLKEVANCLHEMDIIKSSMENKFKDIYKKDDLTENQISFAHDLAEKIVCNYEKSEWSGAIDEVVKTKSIKSNETMQAEVDRICADFDIEDEFLGALIYHGKQK